MNIIDALLGEHGVFYAQFDYVEAVLSDEAPLATTRALAAMLTAALAPHAHMEDEFLFEPAVEAGAPAHAMGMMHRDHEEIEHTLEEAGTTRDPEHARAWLLEAVQAAREHFVKEERIAFAVAEHALGEEHLLRLGERWAAARGVALVA